VYTVIALDNISKQMSFISKKNAKNNFQAKYFTKRFRLWV